MARLQVEQEAFLLKRYKGIYCVILSLNVVPAATQAHPFQRCVLYMEHETVLLIKTNRMRAHNQALLSIGIEFENTAVAKPFLLLPQVEIHFQKPTYSPWEPLQRIVLYIPYSTVLQPPCWRIISLSLSLVKAKIMSLRFKWERQINY